MTQELMVCGQWPLTLRPGSGGHYAYLHTGSQWNPRCFHTVVKGIPTGLRVREYFGGVGIFSTIIQQVLKPATHVATDLDLDCALQLGTLPGVRGGQHDAMQADPAKYDLVVLDFPVHTVRGHGTWPWKSYLARRPDYVVFCDTARRRLGLHRALYTSLFGERVHSHQDYADAYSRFLWRTYGYSITREAHSTYTYFRAEPVPPQPVTVEKMV